MQGVQVQSMVGELRSHILRGAAKKKKKNMSSSPSLGFGLLQVQARGFKSQSELHGFTIPSNLMISSSGNQPNILQKSSQVWLKGAYDE